MTTPPGQKIATYPLKYKGEKNESELAPPVKNSREPGQCGINDPALSNRSYSKGDHYFLTNRKIIDYIVHIWVNGDLWQKCHIQGA
jgi:hypothetical protein